MSRGGRLRIRATMAVAFGVAVGCIALPAAALATSAPSIGASAAGVSQNEATLRAPIRPEGLETRYELWLEYPACQAGDACEPATSERIGEGVIPASRLEQVVSVELTSLKWNYSYNFVVLASNSDGTRQSYPQTFTTGSPPPPGLPDGSGGEPAKFKAGPGNLEGAERTGNEAPRLEEEREAQKKEEEERPVKEAAARAAEERESREAGERAGREAAEREAESSIASSCVVPRLRGDSLTAARRALAKDHCVLGSVGKPRKHRGALVVISQSTEAGRKLQGGTAIAVHLGTAGKKRSGSH